MNTTQFVYTLRMSRWVILMASTWYTHVTASIQSISPKIILIQTILFINTHPLFNSHMMVTWAANLHPFTLSQKLNNILFWLQFNIFNIFFCHFCCWVTRVIGIFSISTMTVTFPILCYHSEWDVLWITIGLRFLPYDKLLWAFPVTLLIERHHKHQQCTKHQEHTTQHHGWQIAAVDLLHVTCTKTNQET